MSATPTPGPTARRGPLAIPGIVTGDTIEPLLGIKGLTRVLSCGRSTIERMLANGKLPRPDLVVGRRSPRWRPMTIRRWIDAGGKGVAR